MTRSTTPSRAKAGPSWPLGGLVFASVLVAVAAGAGTPLLSLYQREWGFPLWQLTVAFAVYAVALLATLLVAGSLSDHVGRRPVLLGALCFMILASCLFWIDNQIGWVIAARAIQGVATGAATSTFSAAIIELSSERRRSLMTVITSAAPVGGLALGAFVTGLATDLVHDPTKLVFSTLAAGFLIGIVCVLAARETSALSPGAVRSLRPRLVVLDQARSWFVAVVPLVAAGWMFSGLFLGLAPTFDRTKFGLDSGALNGVIVALQPAAAAIFGLVFSRVQPQRSALTGAAFSLAGAVVAVVGLATGQLLIVAIGAVIGGAGQGAGFGASLRILAPLADNTARGGLLAATYLVAYASYGIPVLISGTLANLIDLTAIVLVYGVVVAIFAACALISISILRTRAKPTAGHLVARG